MNTTIRTLTLIGIMTILLSLNQEAWSQETHELELRSDALVLPRTIGSLVDNPVKGMLIYNGDSNTLYVYDGSSWEEVAGGFIRDANIVRQKNSEFTDAFLFGVDELPEDDNSTPNLRGDKTENSKLTSSGKFFFFDEEKGAFRGGELENSGAWGPSKLGSYSFAYGKNVEASSPGAVAFGVGSQALNSYAIAMGNNATASNGFDVALGQSVEARGGGSFAVGEDSKALKQNSVAMGRDTRANGTYAVAMGQRNIANATASTAIGSYNDSLVVGGYSAADRPVFMIGNGTSNSARSNAMVVRQNGKMGIGENDPEGYVHIKQANSLAEPQLKITGDSGDGFVRIEVNREGIDKSWFHSVTTNASDASSYYSFAYEPTPGSFAFPIRMDGNGHTAFGKLPGTNRIEVNGNASKTTAGDWLANSDRRIKTDIKEIDDPYSIINQLRPVKFKYSEEWKMKNPSIKDQYYYNFIAQEYQEVFPESVQGSGEYLESDNKEILQIDTYNAQIVTIAAVKELIKENVRLSKELTRLNQENAQIKEETDVLHEKYESLETRVDKMMNQQLGTNAEQ